MHEKDDARYGRRLIFRFALTLCKYKGEDESTAFDKPELILPVSQSIVYTSVKMYRNLIVARKECVKSFCEIASSQGHLVALIGFLAASEPNRLVDAVLSKTKFQLHSLLRRLSI